MAALAVKASLALQNSSNKDSRRGKKARISPVLLVNPDHDHQEHNVVKISFDRKPKPAAKPQVQRQPADPIGFSRSASVRRFQKYTSRRAKLAVRSFKLGLTTVYEGTAL